MKLIACINLDKKFHTGFKILIGIGLVRTNFFLINNWILSSLTQMQVKRQKILIIDLYSVCWYIFVLRVVETTERNYMAWSEEQIT